MPCPTWTAAQVRAEIGVEDRDFVIVQVVRLDALKDHATALRTLEHCAAEPGETLGWCLSVTDRKRRPSSERSPQRCWPARSGCWG